jgi:hypothetical protein
VNRSRTHVAAIFTVYALAAASLWAQPVGTAFTHQGRLTDAGNPADGPFDFRCTLFDAPAAGTQVGPTVTVDDVAVASGLFTIALDFGASAFQGNARWLAIEVRPGASTGAYTAIGGRQELKPAPNAVFSTSAADVPWTGVSAKPAGFADNVDNDSGGTVTGIATGAGLTGGPITTSGTVSVATGGIATAMLADGAVSSAKIANGAVGLAQINTAQVQARASGTCPLGSYLRGLSAAGALVCERLPDAHSITAVEDSAAVVGAYTSIAIPADGRPVVSHYDATNGALRFVKCGNAGCTAGNLTRTVDSAGANITGLYTSIAIGGDGFPVISYQDSTVDTLRVAKCGDALCATANLATVDDPPANAVGESSSIAIGTDGFPVIAYHDGTADDLKVAKCTNASCSLPATITTLDPSGSTGFSPSIAIGADGLPVISYVDTTADSLRFAKCTNAACTTATVTTVDPNSIGQAGTDVVVPADGLPVISYHEAGSSTDFRLKVLKCGTPSCNAGNTITLVDSAANNGLWSSIAIGADGLPVISYYRVDPVRSLGVVKCGNAACSAGNVLSVLDGSSGNLVGEYTSIAAGSDGLPVISYFDQTNGNLKVMKCGSAACN